MPDRYIREKILTSEKVCSLDWSAEVFFRRLLNRADDYARFTADPALLRVELYPRQVDSVRLADILRWIAACETAELIVQYKAKDGKALLVIPQFDQRIRAEKSKWDVPPKEVVERHRLPLATGECPPPLNGCQADVSHMSDNRRPPPTNTNTNTNTRAVPNTEAGALFPLPQFEPVKRGLWDSEYDSRIKDAEAEIKRVRDNAKAYHWTLKPSIQKFIDEITKEGKDGWEKKVGDKKVDRDNYDRVLKNEAKAVIHAWQQRIQEIRNAKNGVSA